MLKYIYDPYTDAILELNVIASDPTSLICESRIFFNEFGYTNNAEYGEPFAIAYSNVSSNPEPLLEDFKRSLIIKKQNLESEVKNLSKVISLILPKNTDTG